jgi:hypothetical protein
MTEVLIEGDHLLKDAISYNMDKALQAAVDSLTAAGQDVPDRRYKTFGQTVWDCEQLTITMIQAYLGDPGDQAVGPQMCDGPRSGVFQMELVRCVPSGYNAKTKTAPNPEQFNEKTEGWARDAWALLDVPRYLADYHTAIADVSITEPQGGFLAIVLNLVVQL